MTDKTGGPAFPIPGLQNDEEFNGMTLRDYFAAKALQGLLANEQAAPFGMSARPDDYAQKAYRQADAMIEARQS